MQHDGVSWQEVRAGADDGRALFLLRATSDQVRDPTPVLLLHGSTLPASIACRLSFDGRSWLDDLACRGRDAWALDIRGYGRSWRPEDDGARPCAPVADNRAGCGDVGIAIDRLREVTGAPRVDVAGWSWGATVAAAAPRLASRSAGWCSMPRNGCATRHLPW